jgi:hypothetical protein
MMKIYRDPIDFFMFSSVAFLFSMGFEAPQSGLVGCLLLIFALDRVRDIPSAAVSFVCQLDVIGCAAGILMNHWKF